MINTGIWGNPIFKIPPEENQDAMRCIPGGCFNQQDLLRWVEHSCVPTEYGCTIAFICCWILVAHKIHAPMLNHFSRCRLRPESDCSLPVKPSPCMAKHWPSSTIRNYHQASIINHPNSSLNHCSWMRHSFVVTSNINYIPWNDVYTPHLIIQSLTEST